MSRFAPQMSASSLSPVNVQYVQGAYRYRSPFRDLSDVDYIKVCVDDLRNVIETTTSGDVACLIAEPIQGVGGFVHAPDGLLGALKKELDNHGILLMVFAPYVIMGAFAVAVFRERIVHRASRLLSALASRAHRFDCLQCEAAGKDRATPEEGALVRRQEVVAPVDQRAQRSLAGQRGAVTARQQAEPIVETLRDALD